MIWRCCHQHVSSLTCWHHPHELQQQLTASPTKRCPPNKEKDLWWLMTNLGEISLSSIYFISHGYNGNWAQTLTFTLWSYTVRWNEFQAQHQAALLFAVSNPEGSLKAKSYQPWQHGLIHATMISSDGYMDLDILSALSGPAFSMAHPSLPFSHPWLLLPCIFSR